VIIEKQFRPRLLEDEMAVVNMYRAGLIEKPVSTSQYGLHVVSGCWHFPFHNKAFFESFLNLVGELSGRIVGFHLIGDIIDNHSISRHNKGRITIPGLTLSTEYAEASKSLNRIDKALGDKQIIKNYFWGNHEDWYNQEMGRVDQAKLGKGVVKSPTEALKLIERGYDVQENYKTARYTLGDIELIHGEYVNEHAAKKHLDVMKRSVMFVHTHRMQQFHTEKISAFNIGWGGDKDMDVFSYTTRVHKELWKNGFALVYVDEVGKSYVTQLEFINGKIFYGGNFY